MVNGNAWSNMHLVGGGNLFANFFDEWKSTPAYSDANTNILVYKYMYSSSLDK